MRIALRTPWRQTSPLAAAGFGPVRARSSPVNGLRATCGGNSTSRGVSSRTGVSRITTPTSSKCSYSSGATGTGQQARRSTGNGNKTLKYAIVGGALGAGTILYWDDVQHLYRATSRTGRVVGALAVCINEWVSPSPALSFVVFRC